MTPSLLRGRKKEMTASLTYANGADVQVTVEERKKTAIKASIPYSE